MKYVRVPRELTTKEISAEGFCFSPGRYVRFVPTEQRHASHFQRLNKLVVVREQSVPALKREEYSYAEIGDIDVRTGGVVFRKMRGYQLPTSRPALAKSGDVLVSTVRTYRKGIGLVTDSGENLVTTNAILNFSSVKTEASDGITLPYIYSFLRSDFFVEQVWSLLNRGVYPRMDTGALDKIFLPITPDKDACAFVSALALAVADKERAIRERNAEIDGLIEQELIRGLAADRFRYSYPSLEDLRATNRLDAGIYAESFKREQHRITHYEGGWGNYKQLGFTIARGQNLQVSCIGQSIYSSKPRGDFYRLVAPTDISEFRTVHGFRYLGNKRKLETVKKGDVIFGAEGFGKGRSVVLVDEQFRTLSNIHGIVFHPQDGSMTRGIFLGCFLGYLRKVGMIDAIGAGGSGGSLAIGYLDQVPIPRFPDSLQQDIATLYHNPAQQPADKLTLSNFVAWHKEWNATLGIWELDGEMKRLQRKLTDVQERIIEGSSVELFL